MFQAGSVLISLARLAEADGFYDLVLAQTKEGQVSS